MPCGMSITRPRSISGNSGQVRLDFAAVVGPVDDELQLVVVLGRQPADHLGRVPLERVPPGPLRIALGRRRRVRQLRADRHQVARHRQIERAGGLDRDVPARRREGRHDSGISSANSIGSPPVRTTCRTSAAASSPACSACSSSNVGQRPCRSRSTRARISSTERSSPSGVHEA